jgi:mannose-1-phosphate guanylyltransferase
LPDVQHSDIRALILAGGAGRRLAAVTGQTPKQFWSFAKGRSLLEDTAIRLAPLASPSRTVTVVDSSHRLHIHALGHRDRLGEILYQPCDRGTAAGVLLGLHAILDRAPDALVLLTPADHGVRQPRLFRFGVREAVAFIQSGRADVVLFGAEPDAPSGDYGWITAADAAGPAAPGTFRPVASFAEKPTASRAAALLSSGAVWNTMVLVARARGLLGLYRRHLPEMEALFDEASRQPLAVRRALLEAAYPRLPAVDFSRHVLTPAGGLMVYTWPAALGWSDLGTPERLERWLRSVEPRLNAVFQLTGGAADVA